jgi:hypothetical protein
MKAGKEKRTLEIEFEWVEGGSAEGPVSLG